MTTAQFRGEMVRAMSEDALQALIVELAHALGWHVAHFRRVRVQRANGSTYYETPVAVDGKGWPDLVLAREHVIFAELKAENGTLDPAQKDWRDWLKEADARWFMWRPRDWESGAIQRELSL